MKNFAIALLCAATMFCTDAGNAADRETVAQNLGELDGKIIIDVSMFFQQGEDGYPKCPWEGFGKQNWRDDLCMMFSE